MDAVEEIKQRLSIEDVVGEYVELKRAGRNWKGLSPFSNERTPSFMVSPEKQIWHDFSSGKGGSMFGFIMEMEGVDFKGALEILARKAGIDLEQFRGGGASSVGRGREKERLYAVLEQAARFYQSQLKGNLTALDYLKRRQFTGKTIIEWRIGYSPADGMALVKHLKSKQFTTGEIQTAGLSAKRYRGGQGDMFRGRLMIPLADPQGRIIGFTARLLADDPNAPKYINTPQTPLYDKSRHVFGLHLAKDAIRRSKFVVVAEGNLDVIMSHQVGVRQVVATAGTALTEAHLKALSRFTGDIRLSFDADKAGLAATERAIPIASKVDVSLSVITIPSGKDPDELIKQDVSAWERAITRHQYALDWLIKRYTAELDITTAKGKKELSDIVLAVVRRLGDRVEQEHYIEHISALLGVSREALTDKLHQKEVTQKPKLRKPSGNPKADSSDKALLDYMRTQNRLLSLALMRMPLRDILAPITPDMLVGDDAKALLTFLHNNPEFQGWPADSLRRSEIPVPNETDNGLTDWPELKPIADYVKILALHYEELYENVDNDELQYEATRLQAKLIEQYVKTQKQKLLTKMQTATEAETETLLQQATQLDNLLRTYKGGA